MFIHPCVQSKYLLCESNLMKMYHMEESCSSVEYYDFLTLDSDTQRHAACRSLADHPVLQETSMVANAMIIAHATILVAVGVRG